MSGSRSPLPPASDLRRLILWLRDQRATAALPHLVAAGITNL
jgi:hypothetical protein